MIHGVAGSGKTLILVYRCLKLAAELNKPVLVLCFNKSLAARLRHLLNEKGIGDRQVSIRPFHGWCVDLLRQYQLPIPSSNQFPGMAFGEELTQRVIQAVETGTIPAGTYGAVLIDEGHDFQPSWLKLVVQMVDPSTNALLLLYDDSQHIYGNQTKRKVSFKSLGIQAQGRTTILKVNYRNTEEILSVAYTFAKEYLSPTETQMGTDEVVLETTGDSEDSPLLVLPQSAGRHGPQPKLIQLPSFSAEVGYLAQRAQQLYDQGIAWGDMAVVYRNNWMAEKVRDRLQKADIPVEWINQAGKQGYDPSKPSIKLVTMHSSKGLEFPVVFIPGLGYLPDSHSTPEEEARLLYVAMTRAIDQLVMSGDRPSSFMK
ncbi:ATP-binding domain-containing protein [Leptolyngbya sp. PL-A3]|uniref:DEAD/DEAH box helicase n=1 Tax=Leptolyngbya sp. PL-A3 TaxID=2933911 RepID=UPI00329A5FED